MSNEYLKAEYERRPWDWQWQFYGHEWWYSGTTSNGRCPKRLKPRLPANLPEPPEQAYCLGPNQPGGVFLHGRIRLPQNVHSFKGWILGINNKEWFYSAGREGTVHTIYIIDLSDPNAEAIIELNRPEAKPQGTRNTLTIGGITVDLTDPQIHDALRDAGWCHENGLVADGWTPPDNHADEWAALPYCQVEVLDEYGDWQLILTSHDRYIMELIKALASGGFDSVRIRRKHPSSMRVEEQEKGDG